jgi:hypothetical protein
VSDERGERQSRQLILEAMAAVDLLDVWFAE